MKITFPHMGNLYIAIEALLGELGHEFVVPPKSSKRTLTLGTKYSPETICLPLKLGVGNLLEGIELGADTALMVGGRGPCRLGYYAALQQEILYDLGKEINFIVLDHPKEDFTRLKSQVVPLVQKGGLRALAKGVALAWEKLKAVEELEWTAHFVRPREAKPRATTQALNRALQELRRLGSIRDIRRRCREECDNLLALASTNAQRPIKVGIVGEIYTILEPFANLDLEERLGYLGVEVFRTVSLARWLRNNVILSSLGLYRSWKLRINARGYLRAPVGGHGLDTVAQTAALACKGYDGAVHILPFTCMPEIVAQCVLPNVSSDCRIPVLSLVVDEHTGETGFQTRLEAFVDLLSRQRKGGAGYEPACLSWS
jgi:predicted nucleotide-binding protein (sugar kinase/HSP70/actin superfamily)